MNDLYEVLGINKSASADDIKKAYRKLTKKFHPDTNPNDNEAEKKYKEINAAYEILSDNDKRQQYDMGGSDFSTHPFSGFGNFSDFFSSFGFNSNNNKNRTPIGTDIHIENIVELKSLFSDININVKYNRKIICPECKDSVFTRCSECNGTGKIQKIMRSGNFQQILMSECPKCLGSGEISNKSCSKCNNTSLINSLEEFDVTIPSGVVPGQQIRIANNGNMSNKLGGENGDLYIRILVDNKYYNFNKPGYYIHQSRGIDLGYNLDLDYIDAILGNSITINKPDESGKYTITVPPGTIHGAAFKLAGKGLGLNSKQYVAGDIIINVRINIPKTLSKEEKKLLKKIQKLRA